MKLTVKERMEFKELTEPLIKWLNETTDPHTYIIISCTSAKLVEGVTSVVTDKYVKD